MIALLSERPDAIPALAAGYRAEWGDWYGPQGPGVAEADLWERAGVGPMPFGVVALENGLAIGTAAATAASIASRAHLSPWLTGLWVAPEYRGHGVAGRLIDALVAEAARRGIGVLLAATENGRALFVRQGWRFIENANEDGHRLAVLAVEP